MSEPEKPPTPTPPPEDPRRDRGPALDPARRRAFVWEPGDVKVTPPKKRGAP